MPAAFVTATGTEIGKTFVTAGLARHLRQRGREVAVLKPVVSGFDPQTAASSDPAVLLEAIGQAPTPAAIAAISPWRYMAPLSPDMAAASEGGAIDLAALAAFCGKAHDSAEDVLLIEGIGGLMVPLGAGATVRDLIAALPVPPILVAGTYVGTLSHTLCALEALKIRGISVAALVLDESPDSPASPEATCDSLRNFCAQTPILILRRGRASENARNFDLLADLVLSS